jgi:bifunctional pyridoxal-dependent enzyme with beta-cystathionase and maltose regulon repressor activities
LERLGEASQRVNNPLYEPAIIEGYFRIKGHSWLERRATPVSENVLMFESYLDAVAWIAHVLPQQAAYLACW